MYSLGNILPHFLGYISRPDAKLQRLTFPSSRPSSRSLLFFFHLSKFNPKSTIRNHFAWPPLPRVALSQSAFRNQKSETTSPCRPFPVSPCLNPHSEIKNPCRRPPFGKINHLSLSPFLTVALSKFNPKSTIRAEGIPSGKSKITTSPCRPFPVSLCLNQATFRYLHTARLSATTA